MYIFFSRSNSCIRVTDSIDGLAVLKKYYCQLLFIKNRLENYVDKIENV